MTEMLGITMQPAGEEAKEDDSATVDKTLVAMFLKLAPEERLRANDNAIRAIGELRDAYHQRK